MRLSIILWINNAEVWVICRCRMLRQRTKTQSLIITTSCEIDRRMSHRGNYIGQKTLSIMMLTLSKWHILNRESAPRDHMAMIGKLSSVPNLTRRKPKGKVPRSKRVASCPPSPISPLPSVFFDLLFCQGDHAAFPNGLLTLASQIRVIQ